MALPPQRIYNYSLPSRFGVYPVTVDEMAEHLRIDSDVLAAETDYIQALICSATDTAEKWTKRTLVDASYKGYLDDFCCGLEYTIRRGPLISADKIEYYVDDILITLDQSEYYSTESPDFAKVIAIDSWPTNADDRRQAIVVNFTAGYGDNETPDPDESSVPCDLKEAIKQHVAALYMNRGDCLPQNSGLSQRGAVNTAIPVYTRMVYEQYRIIDLYAGC